MAEPTPPSFFTKLSRKVSDATGSHYSFVIALLLIVGWALTGPIFKFSDTWQLVINTGTTILTFLMVFVIQNSQNRDTRALQIKLDELIRATEAARNTLLDLEEMEDSQLKSIQADFEALARKARDQQDQ
ncbi:MAG TPA: low affinity iron permease family protein [Fimbriimonadaceae bacterium]|nr:low affinity iron permease family protein [Fimbriimonadaceae bacterium]